MLALTEWQRKHGIGSKVEIRAALAERGLLLTLEHDPVPFRSRTLQFQSVSAHARGEGPKTLAKPEQMLLPQLGLSKTGALRDDRPLLPFAFWGTLLGS